MSALDELREIDLDKITPLQAAIVFLSGNHPEDAAVAAEELAALQADRERLSNEKTADWLKLLTFDDLTNWMEHVAGVGSPITIRILSTGNMAEIEPSPHYFTDCETCKEIAAYLARYHEGEGQ